MASLASYSTSPRSYLNPSIYKSQSRSTIVFSARSRKNISAMDFPPPARFGAPDLRTSGHLRHVASMAQLPSGAGQISQLNAVVLGESLASEEHDLIFPSEEFSSQALVASPEQYGKMYRRSIEDPSGFWSEIAEQFFWKKKWGEGPIVQENLDVREGPVKIEVGVVFVSGIFSVVGVAILCSCLIRGGFRSGSRGR